MRPPTEARRDGREHEHLGRPPLQLPATTSEAHALIRRTNTHKEGGAPPQSLGVRVPGENCYRWRTRVQAGTSGDAAPRRCGVPVSRRLGALCSRAAARRRSPAPSAARCPPSAGGVARRRLARGRRRSRVMRRASSRGSTSISPRELRREPGAQADSSARDALGGSRRREGRTLEMRPWTSASQPHAHGRAARGSGAARATGRVA